MAGKRRIASNAPRTPLSRRSEKETEELAVTPRQELAKMGLCKEDLFMCSQPADSQIDVRWDCNSPEALLQFKRYRGQFLRSEVADIVKKLADETEDGPSTTEPLLGLWMSSKDDSGRTKPFKNNIQRRSDRRRRIRKHPSLASDQCADELLEKLTMALHRHEDAGEETLAISPNTKQDRVSPGSPKLLTVYEESEVIDQVTTLVHHEVKPTNNASKDLFENSGDASHKQELHADKTSGINSLVTGNLQTVTEEVLEDDWSDDDLFANESLLMKAATLDVCSPTPQPTSRLMKRKLLMNSPSAPLIKTKRFSDAPCATSTQINQNGISGVKSLPAKSLKAAFVRNEEACHDVDLDSTSRARTSTPYRPDNTSDNLKLTTGVTIMSSDRSNSLSFTRNKNQSQDWKKNVNFNSNCRYNGHIRNASTAESSRNDVIPSSQTLPHKRNIPSTTGCSFKRHNTFPSMTVSPRNGRALRQVGNPVVQYCGLSTFNKGISKTSKDSAPVSKPVTFTLNRAGNNTYVPTGVDPQGCGQALTSDESTKKNMSGLPKPFDFVPSPRSNRRRRSSVDASMFNTSLTDDLLCQLAEPDEILDSQFDMGVMEQTKHSNVTGYQNTGINSRISAKQETNNTRSNQQNHLPLAEPETKKHFQEALKASETKKTACTVSKIGLHPSAQSFGDSSLSSGAGCSTKSSFTNSQIPQTLTQNQPGKYHFKSHHPKPDAHKPVAPNPGAYKHGAFSYGAHKSDTINLGAPKPDILNSGGRKAGNLGAHKPGPLSSGGPKPGTLNSVGPKPGLFSSEGPKPGPFNHSAHKPGTLNAGGPKPSTLNPSALKPITDVPSGGRGTGKLVPLVSTNLVKTSSSDVKDAQSNFNDSFMNDDELSNPEVIAMLDEVEFQATQASQGSKSPVFKCTPDEIQKKKKAAMERRKKNLQLQKKKPVLRSTSKHYKPLF